MKVGMCHVCYAQDVKVSLTQVKSNIQTSTEVTKVPLCQQCRENIRHK